MFGLTVTMFFFFLPKWCCMCNIVLLVDLFYGFFWFSGLVSSMDWPILCVDWFHGFVSSTGWLVQWIYFHQFSNLSVRPLLLHCQSLFCWYSAYNINGLRSFFRCVATQACQTHARPRCTCTGYSAFTLFEHGVLCRCIVRSCMSAFHI